MTSSKRCRDVGYSRSLVGITFHIVNRDPGVPEGRELLVARKTPQGIWITRVRIMIDGEWYDPTHPQMRERWNLWQWYSDVNLNIAFSMDRFSRRTMRKLKKESKLRSYREKNHDDHIKNSRLGSKPD